MVECPHCKYQFSIEGLTGDSYARFYCPNCKKELTDWLDKVLLENDMF